MTRRVSVRGIVLHEDKLLCVRLGPNPSEGRAAPSDYWCLPGGGLEEGESLHAGLEREMIEETGVKPVAGQLMYVQQFSIGGKEYMDFFFHVTNHQDYVDIDLSKTTHGKIELAEIDFIDPASNRVLPEFLAQQDLRKFADSDEPTRVVSRL